MSPTATIAAVVTVLLVFAYFFQTDVKDPAYEEYLKRQALEQKADVKPIDAAMGIQVTDAGVTKGGRLDPAGLRLDRSKVPVTAVSTEGASLAGSEVGPGSLDPLDPAQQANRSIGIFPPNTLLHGTFVGVPHLAAPIPAAAVAGEVPTITFRRDGTFSSQSMSIADGESDVAGATTDRGSGKYKLDENALELTFTDGLTRKRGNKRSYTIVPVAGPDVAPTVFTLQGHVFKLDPRR